MYNTKVENFEHILKNVEDNSLKEEEIIDETKKEYFRKLVLLGWIFPEHDIFK